MSSDLKKILALTLLIIIMFVTTASYHFYQIIFNEDVYSYSRLIPLGENHVYFLRTNLSTDNFFRDYPEGVLFYLERTNGEHKSLTPWGHWIVESKIPLEPYLNQKVIIKGEIVEGQILVSNHDLVATAPSKLKELFNSNQVGVRVDEIMVVD